MPAVTIRPVEAADLPAVRALLARTWHATYDTIFGVETVDAITGEWHSEAALARGFGRDDHRFLLAEALSGAVLGTVSSTLGAHGGLTLDRLYIDPQVQRIGLGTSLLAAAVAGWPGLRRVDLEIEPRNAPALAFYRRHGFVPFSRSSGGGYCHVVMRRHVPPRGYSVRRAEVEDVSALRHVITAAIRETNSGDYPPATIDFLAADMNEGAIAAQQAQWDMWVVTDSEGAVCGTAAFDGARVRKLFVAPEHQRQGLASVLMDAVEGAAWDAGVDVLATRASLTAEPFFAGRGYASGEAVSFGPAAMVAMEKVLPRA